QLLGSGLRLKWIPVVRFVLDDSIERGNRVLAILDEIETKDARPSPPSA
ncbi:MAG: Ribosome-binding factor, partial [Verrucomicrobiota bacterium]